MLARLRFVRAFALLAVLGLLGTACSAGDDGTLGPEPADAAAPDAGSPVLDALAAVEGVTVLEELAFADGYRRFRIAFEQPVDHADPDGPRFIQMLTLMHRGWAAPMILVSTGYHDFVLGALAEPALLLEANQIVIEHRYFGASRPQPLDWSYLDIEQAAADHHRVVEALKPLYTGRWISTGASKGGMTSVFHRRFHPDDVFATVAYVAPLSFSSDDTRYEAFFDDLAKSPEAGACMQRVRDLQRQALQRSDELLGIFAAMATQQGYTFTRVGGLARAVEMGVVELEWTFWQLRGLRACDSVPADTAGSQELADFIDDARVVWTMSDQEVALFEAYYYQALTQIGYPSVPFAHLADLLKFDYEAGLALLAPDSVAPVYDPEPMRDVADWLANGSERIMLVYGAQDPWSAGAMALGKSGDSAIFYAPEASHGAKLDDLSSEDGARALEMLRAWAGVPAPVAGQGMGAAALAAPSREGALLRPRLGL